MKKIMLAVICLSICFILSQQAFGGEQISPFGSLAWDDGILESYEKILALKGLEEVYIDLGGEQFPVRWHEKEPIQEVLERIVKQKYAQALKDESRAYFLVSYNDKNGKEVGYIWNFQPSLVARPVVVKGVPFTLTIEFKNSDGFAVTFPDKVLKIKKYNISCPLFTQTVSIFATSPKVETQFKALDAMLEKKYRKFDPDRRGLSYYGERLSGAGKDESGNLVGIIESNDPKDYGVNYVGFGFEKIMSENYDKHTAKLETAATQGKPDMSDGL